ncbi:MAG: hypothetical protein EP329_16555 [Deltaproteobacteria bacterium]|nr:MAG: hypothetical protein EP329_16555 [Deltaproteobacteria bacterium]
MGLLENTTLRALALALAAPAVLGACMEELPRPSLVDDVRILGVSNAPAQAEPGDTVTLTALVVDPEDRPRTLRWATCLVPEQGFGFFGGSSETGSSGGNGYGLDDPGSCFDLAEAGDPWARVLGEGETATLVVPADLFDDDEALRLTYGLPADIELAAELKTLFLGIAGVNLTVSLRVDVAGRTLEASKRVNVGVPSVLPDNPANENPTEATFHIARKVDLIEPPATADRPADGTCFSNEAGDITLVRGTRYVMTPQNIPVPQPTYAALVPGTTTDQPFEFVYQQENWFFAWFATIEGLDKDASKGSAVPENSIQLAEDTPETEGDLWIVVRDGRGGTTWCATHFTVEDP